MKLRLTSSRLSCVVIRRKFPSVCLYQKKISNRPNRTVTEKQVKPIVFPFSSLLYRLMDREKRKRETI